MRHHRPQAVVEKIKKHCSPPVLWENSISAAEIAWLLETHQKCDQKSKAKFGEDIVVRHQDNSFQELAHWLRKKFELNENIEIDMISSKENIGDPFPYFHVDQSHRKLSEGATTESLYKTFLIPVFIEGDFHHNKTFFAKQYYFHHALYFANNKSDANPPWGLSDYSEIEKLAQTNKSLESFQEDLSHIQESYKQNLSYDRHFHWREGATICFDRTQLHCSNNWKNYPIKRRIFFQFQTLLS